MSRAFISGAPSRAPASVRSFLDGRSQTQDLALAPRHAPLGRRA
jgi:hypothetical protein